MSDCLHLLKSFHSWYKEDLIPHQWAACSKMNSLKVFFLFEQLVYHLYMKLRTRVSIEYLSHSILLNYFQEEKKQLVL